MGNKVPQYTVIVLAAAFFLELMWAERPAKQVEASPWFDSASKLACDLVTEAVQSAPTVSDTELIPLGVSA